MKMNMRALMFLELQIPIRGIHNLSNSFKEDRERKP